MVNRLLWKSRTRHARTDNQGRGSRARPPVETLEDRLAPAVFNVNSTAADGRLTGRRSRATATTTGSTGRLVARLAQLSVSAAT